MDGWMHGCIRIYICIHKHKTLNPKPYVSISTIRCTHSGIWCHRKAKASLGSGVPGFRVQRFRIWGLRFFFEVLGFRFRVQRFRIWSLGVLF